MTKKKDEKKPIETVSSIEFKNKYLKTIITWLNIPLHSQQAIARNRVVNFLSEAHDRFEEERIALIKELGDKDENGELLMNETKDSFIVKTNLEKFNEELSILRDKKAIFDILPSNREYWRNVKTVFANINKEMDIEETTFYEEILSELSKA